MNTYKKTDSLCTTDAAYIAGLIDGEGTVTLTRKHKNEHRQLCVSISSTEIELLEFVLSATGVGKITNKHASKSHHSHSYAYAVYNRQALALLEQTLPYLKSYKRDRAALILKNYLTVTPSNGKYTTEILAKKEIFEQRVLSIKANS
ncbi:LAGLIDADG family homing endonuclease [Pseudomonadota bacterium]